MTHLEFTSIVTEELENIKNILIKKGIEYTPDDDRLSAFKKGSDLLQSTPAKTLLGYLTKHIISIYDMIKSDDKFTKELWVEKITDTISYLLLLLAIKTEEGFLNE